MTQGEQHLVRKVRIRREGAVHLIAGDFSACGRCGPTLRFTKLVTEMTCRSCRYSIVVNLNDASDWRLKHPWQPAEEE